MARANGNDQIPVIDLAPYLRGGEFEKRDAAQQINDACMDTGFFMVVGHGVSEDLIRRVRQQAVDFFALPPDDKLKVERPPQRISRGYSRVGDRALAFSRGVATPPDIHEAFAFGPERITDAAYRSDNAGAAMVAPNIWPDKPAGFKQTMIEYYDAMSSLGANIMRVIAVALKVDEGFFRDKFDHQPSVARLIRYPAVTTPPLPGQLRSGEHTDYGTLTLLRGDDTPGGLQVKLRHGGWIDARPVPDSFVCNIGDVMMRWTNDRWVSNLHRVAVPPPQGVPCDRISLVFFQTPNHDAVIECIESCMGPNGEAKYPPITSAEHYLGKAQKTAHRRLDAGVASATAKAG